MSALQPDQQPHLWDDHVSLYEEVFEPFTQELARKAIDALSLNPGSYILDCGAGAGGAALELARRNHRVTAVDASAAMVRRLKERAETAGLKLEASVMDGQNLDLPDAHFDSGLSVFGIILFPEPLAGLLELRRVVRPGGRIGLVTWTAPDRYELASTLRAAAVSVLGPSSPGQLPAQLRFQDETVFQALFEAAGLCDIAIDRVDALFKARSAHWLASRIAFAPGMAAMLGGYGPRKAEILEAFKARLEARFGAAPIELKANAMIGTGLVPSV